MAPPLAVLTGGSGFLGRHVAQALACEGWRVRLLVRREPVDLPEPGPGPEIEMGHLGDMESLRRLCRGAQAVIHVAGLVKARRAAEFEEVNAAGAGRMAAAAREVAPEAAFLLVSSLAARAPQLSAYARSKRGGELAVLQALDGKAWIVRPPAIYGPADRATLGLFQAAAVSPVLPVLGREVRLPLIHVHDAAASIAALATRAGQGRTVALCDGRAGGYGLGEIMKEAARAVGRRPGIVRVPTAAVRAAGLMGDLARLLGAAPMVTSGKVGELLHPDWSLAEGELDGGAPPRRFGLADGFRHTVSWYRTAGWLQPRRGAM